MQLNIKVKPILKQSSNYPLLNVLAILQEKKEKKERKKKKIPLNRPCYFKRRYLVYAEDKL